MFGYVSAGDVCYKIGTSGSFTQLVYPISNGYKLAFVLTSEISATNSAPAQTQTSTSASSSLSSKKTAFLNDARFKNGASWPYGRRPLISSYSCIGCCAYAADYVKYVYGKNSPTSGTRFTNPCEIRTGDVICVVNSQHWFVVLQRTENSLYVAEGNWGGVVKVTNGTYTVEGNTLYRSGKRFRTFYAGYHFE